MKKYNLYKKLYNNIWYKKRIKGKFAMNGFSSWKERNKYTLYGSLFGLMFPLFSMVVILFISSNIWVLVGIISSAPFFLGSFARFAGIRQDNIAEINNNLENLVELRTNAIRNLMDVSGQGFLSFGSSCIVNAEYSKECESIFNRPISGLAVQNLLFYDGENEKKEDFINGFNLYFQAKARPDVIFDLMEKETVISGKNIRIEYRTISDDEVLCILTDISTEKILNSRMLKEERKNNILLNVIAHRKYFASFIAESESLFELIEMTMIGNTEEENFKSLQLEIHTFKGNAAFFSFDKTKECAHEMEYYIADRLILGEEINITESGLILKKIYYSELQVVKDTLGNDWVKAADAITIPKNKYSNIEAYIRQKYAADKKLVDAIAHYRKIPISDMFAQFPDLVKRLSASNGKKIAPLTINGGSFPVLPDKYEAVVSSFAHIIRNMVDHGIETTAERESLNKKAEGKISLDIGTAQGKIIITFADDGRGISLGELQKKAVAMGIIEPDTRLGRQELLSLILKQGISTSSIVTETSGRGVGMTAVSNQVAKLGGKISVNTKSGQGTVFKILLPE